RRGRVRHAQLSRADGDLRLDQHAIEIDFNAVAGIGRSVIQIERVEGDRESVTGLQRAWKVEMVALLIVGARTCVTTESPLGRLFVDGNQTDGRVSPVAGDGRRIVAG